MRKSIYLDYAATTPVDPVVVKAMEPYFTDRFGNASSVHSFGQRAAKAVDEARVIIAHFLNCQPTEVVFTSGATESNNLAIKGVVHKWLTDYRLQATDNESVDRRLSTVVPHVVTTAIEHPSVLESCHTLEQLGLAEVTYVKPQPNGIVRVEDVMAAIQENTVLVSVMYANNEVGTIQPIREIGRAIKPRRCLADQRRCRIIFHTDATQAVQFLPCRVDKLGVDLLSMSAHKIYGPKGIGALFVKKGTPIRRFLDGGAQEFDLRAGTLNTLAIVGFSKAIEMLGVARSEPTLSSPATPWGLRARPSDSDVKSEAVLARAQRVSSLSHRLACLRDMMVKEIISEIPNISLNGDPINRLPNNINIRFNGIDAQTLVIALDQAGIAASAGGACASGAPEPSHVITAMAGEQAAKESVRFTIGKWTTKEEINQVIVEIQKIVGRMRKNLSKIKS